MTLVSVIIPTRNRENCALVLIKTILKSFEQCEVVVCNNSDEDLLQGLLGNDINHPRLIYAYTNNKLSVIENFSRGLNFCKGKYLAYLGDDDLINPSLESFAQWGLEIGADVLLPNVKRNPIQFFWPGVNAKRWGNIGGKLYFSDFSGKVSYLNPKKLAKEALNLLGSGPVGMPRIYLGLISKTLVEKIIQKNGCLFGGISPDVYSSVLISYYAEKSVGIDFPIIIPGVSASSTSGARAERSDVGSMQDAGGAVAKDHISRFKIIDWDSRIPKFYSPYTVWACSHSKAMNDIGADLPIRSFAYLYGTCLFFLPRNYIHVMRSMNAHTGLIRRFFLLALTTLMLIHVVVRYLAQKFILIRNFRPGGAKYQISSLDNSEAAAKAMDAWLSSRSIRPGY